MHIRTRQPETQLQLPEHAPLLMGIVNVTPDSFSDGGHFLASRAAREHSLRLIEEGAHLIDVGAESTRPRAPTVSVAEEQQRLHAVLEWVATYQGPAAFSLDTRNLETAAWAAAAGVTVLNLPFPHELLGHPKGVDWVRSVLAQFDAVVLMHSRGTPSTMQVLTDYPEGLLPTLCTELLQTARQLCGCTRCFAEAGLVTTAGSHNPHPALHTRFVYDPGFGFAKSPVDSLTLLHQLDQFVTAMPGPVLVGTSRKSFLGHATGLPVAERLVPSVVSAVMAIERGAQLVRVHDVAETRATLPLLP